MKILCLSTYPVETPRHGGQHRLANIIAELQRNGHEVRSAGVLGGLAYENSRYFVEMPSRESLLATIEDPSLMEDWAISQIFATEDKYFSTLALKIDFKPDIIFVEQPWLLQFAKRFNNEYCSNHAIICYGSQNIEHFLKYDIVKQHFGEQRAIEARNRVFACELDAIASSPQTFCVSQNDLDWTADHTDKPAILAANGVIDRQASLDDVAAANRITQGRKFALFCASAHPPNITGFLALLGHGPGCFPPDTRLVVAGSAGNNLAHHGLAGSLGHQYIDAGEVPEAVLRGLLETAHLIILPITVGGGTNLKSAEAIWSGQHVVGTTIAMRGFEQFNNARGLAVADDAPAFCAAIRSAFMKPRLSLTKGERENRRPVLWENTLSAMIEWVNAKEIST